MSDPRTEEMMRKALGRGPGTEEMMRRQLGHYSGTDEMMRRQLGREPSDKEMLYRQRYGNPPEQSVSSGATKPTLLPPPYYTPSAYRDSRSYQSDNYRQSHNYQSNYGYSGNQGSRGGTGLLELLALAVGIVYGIVKLTKWLFHSNSRLIDKKSAGLLSGVLVLAGYNLSLPDLELFRNISQMKEEFHPEDVIECLGEEFMTSEEIKKDFYEKANEIYSSLLSISFKN